MMERERAELERAEHERAEHERERMEREAREQEEHHRAQMERREHLHVAAEHLRQAGLEDLANRVTEHLHDLERELHRPPHHPEGRPPEFGELQDQINDLRRAMHELGEQLQQIRRER